jgi:hypothetical protein
VVVVTAISALVTGLFTVVLAISTILLWRETKRTAKAANTSANTAKEAGDAYKRSERAWVGMCGVEARKIINGESVEGFVFTFKWRNAGKSPALRINAMANSQLIPAGAALDMQSVRRKKADDDGGALVPGAEANGPPRPHTLAELIEVAEGRQQLILWGIATYHTVFDDLGERETEEAVIVSLAHGNKHTLASHFVIPDQFSYRSYGPTNHAT